MDTNWKMKIQVYDPSGLVLSLSGIVLGVLLAVAEYKVAWGVASVLILTAALMHIYMQTENKWWMAASVAGAVLTVYLSYATLFKLESLILLLFAYFIIRLAKGIGGRGRVSDGVLNCFLKGPVALIGAYFVCTHSFPFWFFLFPSLSVGLLCVAADGVADNYGKVLTNLLIYRNSPDGDIFLSPYFRSGAFPLPHHHSGLHLYYCPNVYEKRAGSSLLQASPRSLYFSFCRSYGHRICRISVLGAV